MSERFTNAVVEWGGLRMRTVSTTIDRGASKKTFYANTDESVDHSVERGMGKVVLELSYTSDVELSAIEQLVEEPMLVTASSNRQLRFPAMTFAEMGEISKEGTVSVTASGRRTTDG